MATEFPVFESVAQIEQYYTGGGDPEAVDQLGNTALFYARSPAEIRSLIDAGVPLDHRNSIGMTALDVIRSIEGQGGGEMTRLLQSLVTDRAAAPLHVAAPEKSKESRPDWPGFGSSEDVRLYFSNDENDPRAVDSKGNTLAFYAKEAWELDALVQHGVPLNRMNRSGMTLVDTLSRNRSEQSDLLAEHARSLGGLSAREIRERALKSDREERDYEKYLDELRGPKFRRIHNFSSSVEIEVSKYILREWFGRNPRETKRYDFSADSDGNTILHKLHTVTPAEVRSVLRQATKAGVDIEVRNAAGQTPLLLARTPEVAGLLLAAGASVHTRDPRGNSAAHYNANNREMLAFLLEREPSAALHQNRDGHSVLHMTSKGDVVTLFSTSALKDEALSLKDSQGRTALLTARSGEVSKALLVAGANPEARSELGFTAMHFAKDGEQVRILSDAGISIEDNENAFGAAPIHTVRTEDSARMLAKLGCNMDSVDREGRAPIFTVSSAEVARVIAERCTMETKGYFDSRTPALALVINGVVDRETLSTLANRGAVLDGSQNEMGDTLIHHAKTARDVQLLCQLTHSVNTKNRFGRTALGVAANDEVFEELVRQGADPYIRDMQKKTQYEVAEGRGLGAAKILVVSHEDKAHQETLEY